MSWLIGKSGSRFRHLAQQDVQRTAAICGLAAAGGAIFNSAIGAGFLAVEIIQRTRMGYRDLFPAIIASSTAVFFSTFMHWPSFYLFKASPEFIKLEITPWLLLVSLLAGFSGMLFTTLYQRVVKLFKRNEGNITFKVCLGSLAAAALAWSINPGLMGTAGSILDAITSGENPTLRLMGNIPTAAPVWLALLSLGIMRLLTNALTVGSGMSAGFAGPAILGGMLLGAAVGHLAGIAPASPEFFALMSAGFAGLFASIMNVPLAAGIMTLEIFGIPYGFPAAIGAIVGFQLNRHSTIYQYALAGSGSEE
jgi:CIC family chloride channel protein